MLNRNLLTIRAGWTRRLAHLRSDASAHAALDVILGSPVITANRLRDALNVSFPAANTAVAELEAAKILDPTGKDAAAPSSPVRSSPGSTAHRRRGRGAKLATVAPEQRAAMQRIPIPGGTSLAQGGFG